MTATTTVTEYDPAAPCEEWLHPIMLDLGYAPTEHCPTCGNVLQIVDVGAA